MRVAARRRAQWVMSHQPGLGQHHWVFGQRGVQEVIRLGRGEPIVLVPGLAGGWPLLVPLAERLARQHEVILFDLRGERAAAEAPRAGSLSAFADDVADLIQALGLEKPTVFGISFGGAVALELAIEHPDRVGTLVLQGVEARFQTSLGATIARRVLERFPLPTDNSFLNQFFNLLQGGKPDPGPLVDFVVEHCWETDQSVMAHRLALLEAFDVADQLWRIDQPTLVLAGTRDVIVPPARQRALASAIPAARFISLEHAGHIGFLSHRAEVARIVGQFLKQRSVC
jgi:pimeloyl-ACP methyl ester carboxylesterase